jgi:hypothetical protein
MFQKVVVVQEPDYRLGASLSRPAEIQDDLIYSIEIHFGKIKRELLSL